MKITDTTAVDPPAQRKKPVRHVGFLRFLSFLMAIGMIVAAIGFGCQLYFDRTYKSIGDTFVDLIKEEAGKQLEEEKKDAEKYGYTVSDSTIKEYEQRGKTAETINQDIFQKYSSDIKGILAAVIREDPAGLKKAVKAYAINTLKDAPSYGLFLKNAGYPNYDSSFEAAVNAIPTFYSDNKSEVDGIMDDLLGDISNSSIRQPLRKVGKVCSEEFGFRWFMLQIGVRGTLVMIIGGALFLLSLILWLALRGPSAGAAHTGFAAALIIGLILAGGIIAACQFLVKPIVFEEIRDLVKVERENPDWADSVKDLVSDAKAAWEKQKSRLQELYTKLASQIIF